MAVKIRFARIGRHKDPFYRIVVADSRYSASGRYIEQIGYYDPKKDQIDAVVDLEKAREWISKGAQPSDSVRAILSKKGLFKDKPQKVRKAKEKKEEAKVEAVKEVKKPAAKKPAAKKSEAK